MSTARDEESRELLSYVPEGCVRARCGCTWWIAVPRQVTPPKEDKPDHRVVCRVCHVKLQVATQADVDAIGLGIKEAPVESKRTRKGRK